MCGFLGCQGDETNNHARAHHRHTKHAVFLDINERRPFCFSCDAVVGGGAIPHLVDVLEKVRSGDFSWEEGKLIPHRSDQDEHFEELDRMETALGRRRMLVLLRVMKTWREEAERRKPRVPVTPESAPKKPPKIMLEPTVSKVEAPGKTGLRNLGNTCFINSVLQSLSNLSKLRDFFIDHFMESTSTPIRYNNAVTLWRRGTLDCLTAMSTNVAVDKSQISLAVELHNILRVLWSGKWLVVTPFALLDALWRFVPRFRGYVQQDAQEFYTYLLDRLNVELSEAMTRPNRPGVSASSPPNRSIVRDIFEGQFVSEVQCGSCKNVSQRFETFVDLELDVIVQSVARRRNPNHPMETASLYDCVKSFSEWENIGNEYKCDACGKVSPAIKRIRLRQLPRVLCIVLKRFCYTASGQLAKNDAQVTFPLEGFDMSFITDAPTTSTKYDLRSVILHHGISLQKGHYTCVAYNSLLEQWISFNDAKCTVVREEDVNSSKLQPYMLFYERSE